MSQLRHSLVSKIAKDMSILFALLTIAIVFIGFFYPEWIKIVIEWIGNLVESIGNWNYLVAFLSAWIESLPIIGVVLPGMNVMILVGGFWGKTHFIGTILAASIGAMLGNWLGYWLGKEYGRGILEEHGEWFWLWRTEMKILDRQIEKNGAWYIMLWKFHNLTRAFVPFLAWSSGVMNTRRFWLYNTIGSIIWAVSINGLGIFFIGSYEVILDNLWKILLVIFILFIIYIYTFQREKWNSYMREKQQEIEEKIQKKEAQKKEKS